MGWTSHFIEIKTLKKRQAPLHFIDAPPFWCCRRRVEPLAFMTVFGVCPCHFVVGWPDERRTPLPTYSDYKMVCPGPQMSHAHTFSNPRTFGRKPNKPKRLQHYLKIGPSQKHSETIDERHRHRWSTCLLALWPLLFGIFAFLFHIFAYLQATQLNMQEPKKPTVQTQKT